MNSRQRGIEGRRPHSRHRGGSRERLHNLLTLRITDRYNDGSDDQANGSRSSLLTQAKWSVFWPRPLYISNSCMIDSTRCFRNHPYL